MKDKKRIVFAIIGLLSLMLVANFVEASGNTQLVCLSKKQKIKFSECNPMMKDYVCDSNFCQICANLNSAGVYCPANPNVCNKKGLSCSSGNSSVDKDPPVLSVSSPSNNEFYRGRAVMLIIEANEKVDLSFIDHNNERAGWRTICTKCQSSSSKRTFNEGSNNITLRAKDSAGNEAYVNRYFFIDSKKPKIIRVAPQKGFSNGSFVIEFEEANPKSLVLNYGNSLRGMRNISVPLSRCIYDEKLKRSRCEINVPVANYNGQEIQYWVELSDIANNLAQTKQYNLIVDLQSPIVKLINYTINERTANIILNITEENFMQISYINRNESNPIERKLCTRLKNGLCSGKIILVRGTNEIQFFISDRAGNTIRRDISISV